MPQTLLFDLDGTLIDSSASILAALASALDREGRVPVAPLDQSLIGPPLRTTLRRIAGCEDPELIERLADHFLENYDTVGYRQTQPYPGVDAALRTLAAHGHALFIVTNKRIRPTSRILDLLNWTKLFTGAYALDVLDPVAPSKSALIRWVLATHAIDPTTACLIGDTPEDAQAAADNELRFIGVRWGYGRFSPEASCDMTMLENAANIADLATT